MGACAGCGAETDHRVVALGPDSYICDRCSPYDRETGRLKGEVVVPEEPPFTLMVLRTEATEAFPECEVGHVFSIPPDDGPWVRLAMFVVSVREAWEGPADLAGAMDGFVEALRVRSGGTRFRWHDGGVCGMSFVEAMMGPRRTGEALGQ